MKLHVVDYPKAPEACVLLSFGFAANPWVYEPLRDYASIRGGCIPVDATPEEVAHAALLVLAEQNIRRRFTPKLVDEARKAPEIAVVAHGDSVSISVSLRSTLSNVRRAAEKVAQALSKAGAYTAFRDLVRASGAEVPARDVYDKAADRLVGSARGVDVLVCGRVAFMNKRASSKDSAKKADPPRKQIEDAVAKHLSGRVSDGGKKPSMAAPAGFHRAPDGAIGLGALVMAQRTIDDLTGVHVHLHGGHLYISDFGKKWQNRDVDVDKIVAEVEKSTLEGLAFVAARAGYGSAGQVARIASTSKADLKKDLKKIF